MADRTCYATADRPRALLALVLPFVAVGAGIFALVWKGYNVADYATLVSSGQLSWLRQGVAWIALGIWIVRYFPPAWTALRDGPCVISGDRKDLFLPGGHKLSRSSIKRVTIQRGFFRKVAYFDRSQGRIAVSLIFVKPSSDSLLQSLAAAEIPTS